MYMQIDAIPCLTDKRRIPDRNPIGLPILILLLSMLTREETVNMNIAQCTVGRVVF